MGINISKRFNRTKGSGGGKSVNNKNEVNKLLKDGALVKGNYNAYSIDLQEAKSEDVEDALLKDVMRKQLALDSQVFVLNQLLLGLHFFGNYDVEIEKAKDRVRREQNLKSEKIRHCNKSVMMTNELSEAIDRSVIFQMRHGPEKAVKRNLFNHKLYIVHDNVEIVNEANDNMTYSSMSYQPSYRLEFDKEYKRRSGYVRLRFCDHVQITNPDIVEEVMSSDKNDSTETSNSTTSQTMSSLLYRSEDVKVIKDRGIYNSSQGSMSSEYDYTYMASFSEHRPLMAARSRSGSNNGRITDPLIASIIPEECITQIKRMITVSTVDQEEGASLPSDNLEYKFQYMEQRGQYLNSKMFMNHFKRIFRDQISENLEIGTDQLMYATWKGASIYCPVQGNCGKTVNHYEIIPAIACPWPSESIDWFQEKRVQAAFANGPKTWMTEEMIGRIFDLNCHAIPIGYVSKNTQRSNNFHRSLEWKITFPDAERYLESRLTDCQLKVYVLAKILYKTYIEPLNIPMSSKAAKKSTMTMSLPDLSAAGIGEGGPEDTRSHFNFITDEHLRAHLFMQCELNAIKWSELNLGGNLMEFLRSFLQCVKKKNLPDFFLPKRNLFEHVPENIITRLHENIFRILENPVMFVMKALKNVRFVRGFYPKINIKRLYSILTIAEPLGLVNPSLYAEEKRHDSEGDNEEVAEKDSDLKYALGSMAEYHQQADTDPDKRRMTKQMKFQEMMKMKQRQVMVNRERRESGDSVNTEFIVKDHMHKYRRKALYDIFVRQFLQVGKKCLGFENHKFVPIYVRQARRLADLLREDHFEIDAHELHELIRELEVLQKHPEVKRSQSYVGQGKRREDKKQTTAVKKCEIWRPPVSEPSSPDQVISPVTFSPMSPDFAESRKSILKNLGSAPLSHQQRKQVNDDSHSFAIKVDIHRHQRQQQGNDTSTRAAAITLNETVIGGGGGGGRFVDGADNDSDYREIMAIELVDKGGTNHHNHMTRLTAQLDGLDSHVSIL